MAGEQILESSKITKIEATMGGYNVTLDTGVTIPISKKAMWSWGRIQTGRKNFDQLFESARENHLKELETTIIDERIRKLQAGKLAIADAFGKVGVEQTEKIDNQKPTQMFIVGQVLHTIATPRHSVLDPDTVFEIGKQVFSQLNIQPWDTHKRVIASRQLVGIFDRYEGMKLGITFNAGDILTTYAISIGQMVELEVCTNPLIWARGMFSSLIKIGGSQLEWRAKMLRLTGIENTDILKEKITTLAQEVMSGKKGLAEVIESSKQKPIVIEQAQIILGAFCKSYGIGQKIQEDIIGDFKDSNGKSLFDLAQSTSHISWSSERFNKDAIKAPGILAAISAALTSIRDPQEMYTTCLARVQH